MRVTAPTLLSIALVTSVTLATPVFALSEEGALNLLGLAQQTGSTDPVIARDAAYAVCLAFGMEPDAVRTTLGEAAWAKSAELSDEFFEVWAPAVEADLSIYLGLQEPICSVWSNTTSTQEAEEVALGMFKSLEVPLETIDTEAGCPIYMIQPEDKIFLSIDSETEEQAACASNTDSSLAHFSFETVTP